MKVLLVSGVVLVTSLGLGVLLAIVVKRRAATMPPASPAWRNQSWYDKDGDRI
jgi:hypothetical protein